MRQSLILLMLLGWLAGCDGGDKTEIYNENNTSISGGVVYNLDEKPINGLYKTYYANGNVKMEIFSQNGLPHGLGKFYDEDGNMTYQGTYEAGVLNGTLYNYYPDGSLHHEINYKKGVYDGAQRSFDQSGNQTVEVIFADGVPQSGYVVIKEQKVPLTEEELAQLSAKEEPETVAATADETPEKESADQAE